MGAVAGAVAGAGLAVAASNPTQASHRFVPFGGPHQNGVTALPVPAFGLMAALDLVGSGRDDLERTLRALSQEARSLMSGSPIPARDRAYPPLDSGVLGPTPPPTNLSVVVSVGASLFDQRFGLAAQRPRELVKMPFLANDRLDPKRTHGDLLVVIEAESPDAVQFALRQLLRRTRGELVLRWSVEGFSRGVTTTSDDGAPRNLMGFKDGTANLDPADTTLMDELVWVDRRGGELAWAVGGSYQAVRIIRMLVEFWDRTPLAEQEALMGRQKVSGAPLDGQRETDVPDFAADPEGTLTPLDAHIRLANPRTPQTAGSRILRRGFSYTRGFDRAGQLDQGLAFVSYQQSLQRGFLAVQERLNGEPLEEYIRPEGGGFFFTLPGVTTAEGFLGESLLRS
jgi:deferrochelatase/peroxidase EfeB